MALPDLLKTDMGGISPLIDSARAPKETPQSLVKIPAPKKFGPDDVGTMQAQVRSGQTRLDKSYAEQERLLGETGNLTTQLAQYTANLVSYKNEQELFKAKQQEAAAKADSENITKMLDEIRGGPLYKQKQETNKQIAEYSAFVPTEVTAPMLGVLFATIGATGMLLGGNSKNTAKAALSAMNGMAEGFGKGREQYDKERKQAFDSNVKLLQTKLSAINDGLEDARKEAVLNKQAADLKVRETLAANDAQFLQENTNRRGLESTIELVKGQLASLNKSLELQKTKTNQIEGQLQRQSDNLMLKNIQISATQASQQMQRDFLRGQQEDRLAAQKDYARLAASLRPERGQGKVQPIGMAGGQMIMVDGDGNIVAKPVPEGFKGFGRFGEKADPAAKPPPINVQQAVQLRNTLIPELETVLPVLERINRQGDWPKFTGLIGVEPRAAEFAFNKDPEAQKAIRTLSRFRSAEFETAGKALTKVENKILAPLYQSGFRDYNALKGAVEDGLEAMSAQKVAYERQYPQLASQESAARPAEPKPSGPKEGDEAPSKSGKPMVFKNGAWEYKQ
jgi:hypothetical protein